MKMKNYVPTLGKFDDPNIEVQFRESRYDALSFCTTPIEILSYGEPPEVMSHATGFFWEHLGKHFLITNRHVVTGRNTFTNDYLTKELMQPHRIRFFEVKWIVLPNNQLIPVRQPVEIDLFVDGHANFLQDPEFERYKVDIVAIPIPESMDRNVGPSPFVNHFGFAPLLHLTGDTCFVVGYPFRNYVGAMIPIWKNGTIASEPLIPVDNKPMFLLDTLTKDGMSGSPVFRRVFGPTADPQGTMQLDSIVRTEFVGVYSGRMSSPEFVQAGLGISWYANRISRILTQGNKPAQSSIHK
jgi:hypothetical protein